MVAKRIRGKTKQRKHGRQRGDAGLLGRRAALAALGVLALLSGCLEDPQTDTTEETTEDHSAIVEKLEYDGCREMLGLWDMDYEDVVEYLPPGFEPDSFLLPPQDRIGRNASFELLGISCNAPAEGNLLIPWLSVTPPDHLVHSEAEVYRVMLPCIGDAVMVEALEAWGAPCTAGDAGFTTDIGTPAVDLWAFEAQTPEFTITMEGVGAATQELSDEPVFRQFHVADRTVCAITHLELEDHVHWRGHGFRVEANGDVPFPIPDEPGAGLLALPEFRVKMTPMAMEGQATSDECPDEPHADTKKNDRR